MKPLPIILAISAAAAWTIALWKAPEAVVVQVSKEGKAIGRADVKSDDIGRFRIMAWDSDRDLVDAIEVKHEGAWLIASRHDYPADGSPRTGKVFGAILDLKYNRLVTADAKQHASLGVLDPEKAGDSKDGEGFGKRVTIYDRSGAPLVDLIVGKDAAGVEKQRYVREPGSDEVYTCAINDADLSTKFKDWVEVDLMKLQRGDVRALEIDEHEVDEKAGRVVPGTVTDLARKDGVADWTCAKLLEGKEVDKAAVDKVLDALTYLRIKDVQARPGIKTRLDIAMLQQQMVQLGFFPTEQGQLFGNMGATRVSTKDGMTFHLFFGEIVADSMKVDGAKDAKDAAAKPADKKPDRYMAVFVSYDPNQDQDVPAEPKADEKKDGDKPVEGEKKDPKAEHAAKVKEHQEKRQKKLKSLQSRFDKFFYVITDEDFGKLRPKGETLFKVPEKKADGPKTESPAGPFTP